MRLSMKRILIVEDDVINRLTYQVMLMNEGAILEFDHWGWDTLKMLRRTRDWDLIILDLMLSGKSGYHLFEEIREMAKCFAIPIIAVSAAEPHEAMARCRELGFSGYISKPIDVKRFPAQLAQIIEGTSIWAYS